MTIGAMAAILSTSRAAEGGQHNPDHRRVDLAPIWRSLRVVACALAPARGIFGVVDRSRRCASGGHPIGAAKISDGGPVGLALACDTLHRRGRVFGRADGRPVRFALPPTSIYLFVFVDLNGRPHLLEGMKGVRRYLSLLLYVPDF